MIVVLCGGVGGSRFVRALASVLPHQRITAVVNTADDEWFHGLYVSPDPDIVTYTLAGEVDEERGWGLRGDTFRWLESLRRFGHDTWFQIGDRDLATHLHRTRLLNDGWKLSAIMADIASSFRVRVNLLPMSDDRVRTIVETDAGDLPFQEFLVHRHAADAVHGVRFDGAALASPAPGVLDVIASAEAIFIAPSNPIGSIRPILAIPELRAAVLAALVPRIAVSPIVDGRSLQPPAGEMMTGLGYPVDVAGVARAYAGVIDTLIVDTADAARADDVRREGARCLVAPTIMRDEAARRSLAEAALASAGIDP
ncbi:MAG: 2-phospho-L-lactate transferase [Dehalococcoidia bacterium]|nr:MAG: 2-phospho-L-lactate transferase [Dehalococcoidia bacterium]